MYSLPQEIEVWYIIPAIRRELAKILISNYDMTFEKAGRILGITKAAVSQYLSNKRAGKFKIPENIKREIEKSAEIISKDEKKAVHEIQRLLKLIRERGCECEACRKYNPEILKLCNCKKSY
ncbi:transcriptional regulator [Candidatus Pacearchaeota archaeon]|nr:transcriptional regulator [Candidatus Pacearchaeota archaeon]